MPAIGTRTVDESGVRLLRDWIAQVASPGAAGAGFGVPPSGGPSPEPPEGGTPSAALALALGWEKLDSAARAGTHGESRDFGPDLTDIRRKYDRAALLTHIARPNLVVAPEHRTHSVLFRDDTELTGFLWKRTATEF